MLARAEAAVICPMLDGSRDVSATDHAKPVAARQRLRCVDAAELLLCEPDAAA
ncbi:MAG: hypothetical protein GYB50_01570 [Rhodobacteraceae bacterium]|uniref:hypothetical protein n=1 Tax=Salipiger thiooxidans TaxID=282683 RepID=UPI001A903F9A|nr:hypothetical protein [Salipiger thiooxidans]MBN8186305.1 hypothetical protein [Salipiger thiooxidans]MBR9836564.1 hypothetical protein [Paracoccaceae bacterium]